MGDVDRVFGHGRAPALHLQLPPQLEAVIVGLKEVDDAIWLVSFMHYDLGYIDLEQKTLQPIDNPFGTRSSPFCPVCTEFVMVAADGFEPPTKGL